MEVDLDDPTARDWYEWWLFFEAGMDTNDPY